MSWQDILKQRKITVREAVEEIERVLQGYKNWEKDGDTAELLNDYPNHEIKEFDMPLIERGQYARLLIECTIYDEEKGGNHKGILFSTFFDREENKGDVPPDEFMMLLDKLSFTYSLHLDNL